MKSIYYSAPPQVSKVEPKRVNVSHCLHACDTVNHGNWYFTSPTRLKLETQTTNLADTVTGKKELKLLFNRQSNSPQETKSRNMAHQPSSIANSDTGEREMKLLFHRQSNSPQD